MKKTIFIVLFLIASAIAQGQECIYDLETLQIQDDLNLCNGLYILEVGFLIETDDVTLNCNGGIIQGLGFSYGIHVNNANNVKIQNCNISNFEVAVFLENSSNTNIIDSILTQNKIGIGLTASTNVDFSTSKLSGNTINTQEIEFQQIQNEVEPPSGIQQCFQSSKEIFRNVLAANNNYGESELQYYTNEMQERFENQKPFPIITKELDFDEDSFTTNLVIVVKTTQTEPIQIFENVPSCLIKNGKELEDFESGRIISNKYGSWYATEELTITYKIRGQVDQEIMRDIVVYALPATEDIPYTEPEKRNYAPMIVVFGLILLIIIIYFIYKHKTGERN